LQIVEGISDTSIQGVNTEDSVEKEEFEELSARTKGTKKRKARIIKLFFIKFS
jgi:hypothetical protein